MTWFPRRRNRRPEAPESTSSAVGKFAVGGLAALAVVAVAGYLLMRHIGTTEATDNAKDVTRIVGRQIVQPHITEGVIEGRPEAIRRLDRVVRRDALEAPIDRIKIWTRSGRIVYSDEPRLIGARYRLDAEDLHALDTGRVSADLSDLSRPENRFERQKGELLQVYMGIRGPGGRRLLFEAYQPFSSIAASGADLWRAFAPALIGALLVLALIQVPLASSMARRLRRGHAEREALLHRAIEASDRERRRIAGDLHDGVVQRLAGTSFSLAAAADRGNGHGDEPAKEALTRGAAQTRQSVRELRSLLVDIYPPNVREAGLEAALVDVLSPLEDQGIATEVEVGPGLALPPDAEATVFRIAQEAIRNAARHAEADHVAVNVGMNAGRVRLTVTDDGRGLPSDGHGGDSPLGHFGLQLMRDLAADAGGEVDIGPANGGGTRVTLELQPR